MAADALSGRNVWIGIGKQTAFGTPVAPTKFFEVTDISGIMEEYDFKKSDRRVGTRFKGLGSKSGKKVPVSFTVEANAANIGLLLTLAMGQDTQSAAGSAYMHTISITENLSYFTLWVSTDGVADDNASDTVHQVPNCKIISLKLDGTVDDVLKVSIEAVGTTRSPCFVSKTGIAGTGTTSSPNITGIASMVGIVPGASISGTNIPASTTVLSVSTTSLVMSANASGAVSSFNITAPVPTFPSVRSLYIKAEEGQAKVELGATVGGLAQFDETTEFHFSLSNGVAPDLRIDNTTTAASLREGDSEMGGSLKAVYNRNTIPEIKAFQAGTARAVRFTATSIETAATGQPYRLIFTADSARYSGAPTSWDPDAITTELQFEVAKSTSYPTIAVVNLDASAY